MLYILEDDYLRNLFHSVTLSFTFLQHLLNLVPVFPMAHRFMIGVGFLSVIDLTYAIRCTYILVY